MQYTEEEKRLLLRATFLPGCPCVDCRSRGDCYGGCAQHKSYEEAWKPYTEAGLVDTANDIRRLFAIEDKIAGLKVEAAGLRDKHKDLVCELEAMGAPL